MTAATRTRPDPALTTPPVLPEPLVEALASIADQVNSAWQQDQADHKSDRPTHTILDGIVKATPADWTVHETAKLLRRASMACGWDVDRHLEELACARRDVADRECGEHSRVCEFEGSKSDPAGCCLPYALVLVDEAAGRLLAVAAGLTGQDAAVCAAALIGSVR